MNSKQKRSLKRMLIQELRKTKREYPDLSLLAELALAQAQASAYLNRCEHMTLTLRGHGPILDGNRFHLVPADSAAAQALEAYASTPW